MQHATSPQTGHSTIDRSPELLAPAGGPGPFAAALAAGADAIYCGMGSFNARRKADNFDDDSFAAACRSAHLAGARVYVTVNIVIKDFEMVDALELIRRCSTLGADAFIIQDWGLFAEVRRLMPTVETHVSTQANIHDARATAWCRDAGADRVTLSRELSLREIAYIHDRVDIDLEVFAHGSICFSYSGVCLLSSFACAGRSANRGMCAQPCRLPYNLVDERGHVLSPAGRGRPLCPRDTNTTDLLPELLATGAHALKLEGRMKAPDYVYSIVDVYRRDLDDILAGHTPTEDEQAARARQLKRCFNRDFTHAYQDGRSDDDMMSYERSNNRGQLVGEVTGFTPRRSQTRAERFRERDKGPAGTAHIALYEPVGSGDLLELRHDDEPDQFLTALAREDAAAGDVIDVSVPRRMPSGCRVRVIRSQRAIDAADEVLKRTVPRKRPVDVRIQARLGKPFTVELTCADAPDVSACAEGFVVEKARTKAVSREDLIEHVGRLGSSPFEARSFSVDMDDTCGMGFSAVHKVRAEACRLLEERILAPYAERARALQELPAFSSIAVTAERAAGGADDARDASTDWPSAEAPVICALVTSREAAESAREAGAKRLYATTDDLDAAGISPHDAAELGLIPVVDEVCREGDHDRLDPWILPDGAAAVGNISELAYAADRSCLAELRSCIPVHNVACARFLHAKGARGFWLSPELTLDEIERLVPHAGMSAGIVVVGQPRVMTSEHCILQVANACIHDCARCKLRQPKLYLHNIDDRLLPVRTDIHGRSRLYSATPLDLTPQMPRLLAAGVTRFMVDGTLLEPGELATQVGRAERALEAAQAGRRPAPRQKGASAGCLFVGVD
ncbi:U32 family peptidase [Collinsella sp. An2]|uniref:U32 family peptidase n=1 Tax=Collinsella sp. An2 TaxID=1965585 RepID=UPI000B3717C5|nr:U32 family peptidase [Collinsella sp. An2]OUP07202.1 peptidase U32 [Collinsella sp. An2]